MPNFYQEQAIASMADIASRVLAFADLRGWEVVGQTLTRPGGGKTFALSSSAGGQGRFLFTVTDVAVPARLARIGQPRRNGTFNAPIPLAPTKLHLFGNEAPSDDAPYIGIVVEFGYNVFRHMFIGNINKLGDYTGGEVISSNNWSESYNINTRQIGYSSTGVKYLFSAGHDHAEDWGDAAGGMNVVHADNPAPWRKFDGPSAGANNMLNSLPGDIVFGGWADQINSTLARRGMLDFASANALTPINLYGPRAADGNNPRFRPFGHVPGIRLIRMDGIEPGAQIAVGGKTWMVFPEFSRDIRTTTYRERESGYYWEYETSYLLGLAYLMD